MSTLLALLSFLWIPVLIMWLILTHQARKNWRESERLLDEITEFHAEAHDANLRAIAMLQALDPEPPVSGTAHQVTATLQEVMGREFDPVLGEANRRDTE